MVAESTYRWLASGLELSNFLWLQGNPPFQLTGDVVPDTTWKTIDIAKLPVPSLQEAVESATAAHPKLQTIDRKLEVLEAERRLKLQSVLPTLNFNYNFLSKGYTPWKGVGQNVFENNYKYGIEFGLPLFLRQGRGEYKSAKVKIQMTGLQKSQAALEIENKVRDYFNQLIKL